MDGSFIPPPFPFPQAWPRVFAEQQQRWLTPTTFVPVRWQAGTAAPSYWPDGPSVSAAVDVQDAEEKDDEQDGEYEYGYVLSDEWRDKFRSTVQLQQLQKQQQQPKSKKRNPPKAANAEAAAAASASRSGHLQREVQAAKARDLARKWKRRAAAGAPATTTPQVGAMETSLNMLFDEFCDAFQPVVWPHDPLQ